MIEVYKILTEKYDNTASHLVNIRESSITRGSKDKKIFQLRARTNVRKNFFSLRIANLWNELSLSVIDSPNLNTFKNRLDKFWSNRDFRYNYEAAVSEVTADCIIQDLDT